MLVNNVLTPDNPLYTEKDKLIYYSTKINTLRGGKKHINSYKSIYRIIYNKVSELLKLHGFKPEQSYNKKN